MGKNGLGATWLCRSSCSRLGGCRADRVLVFILTTEVGIIHRGIVPLVVVVVVAVVPVPADT